MSLEMINRDDLLAAARLYDAALGQAKPVFDDKLRVEAEHAVAGEIHYTDGQYVKIGRSGIDYTGKHIPNHVWKERPKRFLYLPALMAGYAATRDERYAEAAKDYLADWMRVHPACADWKMPPYDNGLNLGVRIPFFAQALVDFGASPAWDEAFLAAVLEDIACELRFIGAHLSPKGNFRMKQAMTLIECGLCLPFMPDAAEWRRQGVAVMNDADRRQVLPGVVHIECTAGYHSWMTRLFRDCLKLQKAYPELGLTMTVERVAAMVDYSVAATRPNGTFCGLHDSEGAWEGSHENTAAKLRSDFRNEEGLPDVRPPLNAVFPEAGQAFLRDGWGEDATYLTFESTRWGGAHCHLSRNSIQMHAFGRTLLMDPGRIAYEMSDPLGPYAKSTRAHSTVNLNGWNQFTTNPDDFRSFHAPGFDCVSSKYTGGYWPAKFGWWFFEGLGHGLGAIHVRHVFWAHGRWAVVIDEVTRWKEPGRGPDHEAPALESNWQFSPGPVTVEEGGRSVHTGHPDANLLLCFVQAPTEAKIELYEGAVNPHRGWVRDFGRFAGRPAPQVSLACRPWQGYSDTLVTLLVPYRGEAVPKFDTTARMGSAMAGTPSSLDLAWADGTRETVSWMPGLETMLGVAGGAETDGVLLYRREGTDPIAAAVDATYVKGLQEVRLMKSSAPKRDY